MRLRLLVLTSALLCGTVLVSAAVAAAAGRADASFALKPVCIDPALTATKSYFILSVKPGALIKDRCGSSTPAGRPAPPSSIPSTPPPARRAAPSTSSRQSPRRDVASWIVLSRWRVTLAPGADRSSRSRSACPSPHGPVTIWAASSPRTREIQKSNGRGALRIKIRHLTIAAVEVQLPGAPVATVEATGVKAGGEHGYEYVYVHLTSTGNVLVKPAATLTVRNAKGRVVARRRCSSTRSSPAPRSTIPRSCPGRR